MNQPNTPNPEIPEHQIIQHHASSKSSLDSEMPSTQTSGSGNPPKPPRRRPPTTGESGSNDEPWSNYELNQLIPFDSDELLLVNSRRRNGIIIYKRYYAEFAGPGAAVGGVIDRDCQFALPLGNLSLLRPESAEERQRAYALRRQWVKLIREITKKTVPLQRAQAILTQFEYYFEPQTLAQVPDEALAMLVGVFPQTIRQARSMKT